jgi:hypothetical protein
LLAGDCEAGELEAGVEMGGIDLKEPLEVRASFVWRAATEIVVAQIVE